MVRINSHLSIPFVSLEQFEIETNDDRGHTHVELRICESVELTLLVCYEAGRGQLNNSRNCSALTCSLGIGGEIVFEPLTLGFIEVKPALRHEVVGVGEYFGVDMEEDGGHADDRLGGIREALS